MGLGLAQGWLALRKIAPLLESVQVGLCKLLCASASFLCNSLKRKLLCASPAGAADQGARNSRIAKAARLRATKQFPKNILRVPFAGRHSRSKTVARRVGLGWV